MAPESAASESLPARAAELARASDRLSARWRQKLGISAYEMLALTNLSKGPMTIGELGSALALSSGAMTGLADRLEAQERLARVRDARDRRRVHLTLTETTRRELEELAAPLNARIAQVPADAAGAELLRALVACYVETMEDAR
jgi:DNA-binding MarR family transcriptional regulator